MSGLMVGLGQESGARAEGETRAGRHRRRRWCLLAAGLAVILALTSAPVAAGPCVPVASLVADFSRRFGPHAVAAATRPGVARASQRWGTSRRGLNQLFEHVNAKDELRMLAIEAKAGLAPGTLTEALRHPSAASAEQALLGLDAAASGVTQRATHVWSLAEGKTVYWAPSLGGGEAGLTVIEFRDKLQSLMPQSFGDVLRSLR